MKNQRKILIVDDEEDIIEFISYNLIKEGFDVLSATNGAKGIEMTKLHDPDLILLDIMMPEMDGVEVCRKIRQNPKFENTIIAFLTARHEDYSQITALENGGDDYITKPIKPAVLVSRIKALLRRLNKDGKESNTGVLQLGNLKIDRDRVIVVKDDTEIELAKKEFELLNLLASKPGKVFQRSEILSKVWGRDVIVGNRTIDVHVRKLREKLGSAYIKTVKGMGYKFDF